MRSLKLSVFAVLVAATVLALSACSPTFNWRDVRIEKTRLGVLMPCKPEKAQKAVVMAGSPTQVNLIGCDSGGVTFAVSVADVGDVAKVAPALAQWQTATQLNMKVVQGAGQAVRTEPFKLARAEVLPKVVRVSALGQRADGTAVVGQAAYFAQGLQVFQAVMYAAEIKPETLETFFSGLKFD